MLTARSRAETQPVTWEIPVACAAVFVLLAVAIVPAGQGAASWVCCGAFGWPRGLGSLLRSVGGLLTGHPGRALAPPAAQLAPTPFIYFVIAAGELVLTAGAAWVTVLWWRHLGPGAVQGMASQAEAERVLGMSNLIKRRALIRPDLTRTAVSKIDEPA